MRILPLAEVRPNCQPSGTIGEARIGITIKEVGRKNASQLGNDINCYDASEKLSLM